MPRPTDPATWDSNGTNTVAVTGSHQTDGWATDEVPPSAEFNTWQKNVADWIAYLDDDRLTFALKMLDQILGRIGPNVDKTTGLDPELPGQSLLPETPYVYVPSPGEAFPYQGSANNKIKIAPGTIVQRIASASPSLLAYTFDGTEPELTIANGDASHPRVDIVQVKLTYDSGTLETLLTMSVKQGAPAASPTYPDPDAGFVVLCAVVVGTNYAAAAGFQYDDSAGALAVLHDQRMPLGVRGHNVFPPQFMYHSDWSANAYNIGVTKSSVGSGNSLIVPCPAGAVGRVVGAGIGVLDKTTLSSHFTQVVWFDSGGSGMTEGFTDLNGSNMNGSGSNAFHFKTVNLNQFQQLHTPGLGPTVQASATSKMGPPIWTNGRRAPYERVRLASSNAATFEALALRYIGVSSDQNSEWGPAVWYVAGGLS